MCLTCERTGAGYFAQLAALNGDLSAAEHLSPASFAFLIAQRFGSPRLRRHNKALARASSYIEQFLRQIRDVLVKLSAIVC
jgi:hypothetical protein